MIMDKKSIASVLIEEVNDLRLSKGIIRRSDYGPAFFWQTICSHSEKQCEEAWKKLQDPNGKVKLHDDDAMRAFGIGDHIVVTATPFAVSAKVTTGRRMIDTEALKAAIIEAYPNVRLERLDAIIEASKKASKNPLQKRIVEIVK
jgi:hypothetical protein